MFPTHFNPNNSLLKLLQISLLFMFTFALKPFQKPEAISRTELRHENAAWLLNTIQNDGMFEFCASLETGVTRNSCNLEADSSVIG